MEEAMECLYLEADFVFQPIVVPAFLIDINP